VPRKKIDLEGIRETDAKADELAARCPNIRPMNPSDLEAALGLRKAAFSPAEVAQLLGLHPEHVRKMIRTGKLPAAKMGGAWRVSRSDLEAYYQAKGGGQLFEDDQKD